MSFPGAASSLNDELVWSWWTACVTCGHPVAVPGAASLVPIPFQFKLRTGLWSTLEKRLLHQLLSRSGSSTALKWPACCDPLLPHRLPTAAPLPSPSRGSSAPPLVCLCAKGAVWGCSDITHVTVSLTGPSHAVSFKIGTLKLSLPIPRQPRPVCGVVIQLTYLVHSPSPPPSSPPLPSPSPPLHSTHQSLWRSVWLPSQKQGSSVTLTGQLFYGWLEGSGGGAGGRGGLRCLFIRCSPRAAANVPAQIQQLSTRSHVDGPSTSLPYQSPLSPSCPGLVCAPTAVGLGAGSAPCKKETHVEFPLTLERGPASMVRAPLHHQLVRWWLPPFPPVAGLQDDTLVAVLVPGGVNSGQLSHTDGTRQQWLCTSDTDTRLSSGRGPLAAYMLLYQRQRRDAH